MSSRRKRRRSCCPEYCCRTEQHPWAPIWHGAGNDRSSLMRVAEDAWRVAKAASRFGFGVCLSATSLIYVSLGCVLLGLGRALAKFPVDLQKRLEPAAETGPRT